MGKKKDAKKAAAHAILDGPAPTALVESQGRSIFVTAPIVRRQKWEYWRCLNMNFGTFNSLGIEGWELITVVDHYSYFKRPA